MKNLVLLIAFALIMLPASLMADDTVTMQCDPPTHRVSNNDCGIVGALLTAEEVASLEYTFSYRQKDSGAEWTNIDTTSPSTIVTLTGYNTTYEVSVGARFPGESILCSTPLVEFTTSPNTNPPGPCSAFTINRTN